MSARFGPLKRGLRWSAVTFALLTAYIASPPFLAYWSQRHVPALVPVLRALWSPLELYARHPRWPGSTMYVGYEQWAYEQLQYGLEPEADKLLDVSSQLDFRDVPLNLVAEYVSQIHDHPIELTPDTDGEVLVTINSTAPLRDHLEQMTKSHGLVYAVIGKRVVIGPPAIVESMIGAADATAHPHRRRNNVIVVVGFLFLIAAIVLILRRHSGRRRAIIAAAAGERAKN